MADLSFRLATKLNHSACGHVVVLSPIIIILSACALYFNGDLVSCRFSCSPAPGLVFRTCSATCEKGRLPPGIRYGKYLVDSWQSPQLTVDQPNLKPPIATTAQALGYKAELERIDPSIEYLMTLYLSPELTPQEVRKAKDAGIVGEHSTRHIKGAC